MAPAELQIWRHRATGGYYVVRLAAGRVIAAQGPLPLSEAVDIQRGVRPAHLSPRAEWINTRWRRSEYERV